MPKTVARMSPKSSGRAVRSPNTSGENSEKTIAEIATVIAVRAMNFAIGKDITRRSAIVTGQNALIDVRVDVGAKLLIIDRC